MNEHWPLIYDEPYPKILAMNLRPGDFYFLKAGTNIEHDLVQVQTIYYETSDISLDHPGWMSPEVCNFRKRFDMHLRADEEVECVVMAEDSNLPEIASKELFRAK